MGKAKPHPDQFGFSFEPPTFATLPGALGGLDRQVCEAVGLMLNSDARTRSVIAAEIGDVLDEEVSRFMLDAWSSPAREDHRISAARFFALVQVCNRRDVLDQVLRPIGVSVLREDEIKTARLGQLELIQARVAREIKALKTEAPLIREGKEA